MTEDYVKHTTHTDALDTLGSLLDPDDPNDRDAIHLAVYRVHAAEAMGPGMPVYLDDDGRARNQLEIDDDAAGEREYVGIIDPFLMHDVETGDWFWLVVYPRTITSLRHVWEHPSFPTATLSAPDDESIATSAVAAAKKRVADWLDIADAPIDGGDVEEFLDLVTGKISSIDTGDDSELTIEDEYIHSRGRDAGGEIPASIWADVALATGDLPISMPEYFSCGC